MPPTTCIASGEPGAMSSVPGSAVAIARAAVAPLAATFSGAGYRLYLVGGLIRDDLDAQGLSDGIMHLVGQGRQVPSILGSRRTWLCVIK